MCWWLYVLMSGHWRGKKALQSQGRERLYCEDQKILVVVPSRPWPDKICAVQICAVKIVEKHSGLVHCGLARIACAQTPGDPFHILGIERYLGDSLWDSLWDPLWDLWDLSVTWLA